MSNRTTWRQKRKSFRRSAPKNVKPVHPREKHWFAVGVKHGNDGRRKRPNFPLKFHNASGSYYERYKEMYEAGFHSVK